LYKTNLSIVLFQETEVLLYFAKKLSEFRGITLFDELASYLVGVIKLQVEI
jgi:hypothetical protein